MDFIKEVENLGIKLDSDKLDKFKKYFELLVEYNKVMNLTGITDIDGVYLKHFYDSITLVKAYDFTKDISLCDVGSGAGFPSIPLKIVFPNIDVTIVDSLNKRIEFLNVVIKELGLTKIKAIHSRAEEFDHRESFDVVTSRAVANIEKLVDFTMHLVSKKGVFVAMKGNIEEELSQEVKNKLMRKYNIIQVEQFSLPKENSMRSLVVIKNK